jgi:hypothetical protein
MEVIAKISRVAREAPEYCLLPVQGLQDRGSGNALESNTKPQDSAQRQAGSLSYIALWKVARYKRRPYSDSVTPESCNS